MSFRIAIPSYKRPVMLSQKTLTFLSEYGIPSDLIDIFVANEEEKKEYGTLVPANLYDKIVVGHPGIARQRTFIREYYDEGQRVFSIDDDIRGIVTIKENFNLLEFIEQMFFLTEKENLTMWGIYPAGNKTYLKNEIRKGVFYIVACFYGFINRKEMWYPRLDEKEDMWASLYRAKKDGGVLRCCSVAPKTTYWLKSGGLHAAGRTIEKEEYCCDILAVMFPEYVEKVYIRKNGHPEVKIKKLPYTLV